MISTMFLALLMELWVPGQAPSECYLYCMPGDAVSELNCSIFQDTFWVETQRVSVCLGEDSVFLMVHAWPGNAANLSVFKAIDNGYRIAGVYTNCFGGNGVDFVISDKIITTTEELVFRLDCVGHLRAFHQETEKGTIHHPCTTCNAWMMISTYGDTMRVESDASLKNSSPI